jgi:SAM-dependent methyltransferase
VNCRHCGLAVTLPFLDLGSAPPSNAYLTLESLHRPETWYPLRVLVCENCWLVQTEDYAGHETLFSSDYAYFSSYSSSWLDHAQTYVEEIVRRLALGANSLVAEIGANDGYLLQFMLEKGIPCYGVEPTAGTAAEARRKGLHIIQRFFDRQLARQLKDEGRQVDLAIANNVLAHVPTINDFVASFVLLLKPTGIATFEFPHLMKTVAETQFDTAYHEHYSYLSFMVVQRIFFESGLRIFDVEQLTTHGGSIRVFAQRADTGKNEPSRRVAQLLADEAAAGINTAAYYADFQFRAESAKDELISFLVTAKRQGLKVGAYGAAAKGNTLLNFAGVRPDLLPYVVDRNPRKQGRYMPGSHIPIVEEAYLQRKRPDRILVLPWNLIEEVQTQLAYVHQWNAQFVTAIPRIQIAPAGTNR